MKKSYLTAALQRTEKNFPGQKKMLNAAFNAGLFAAASAESHCFRRRIP